MSSSEIIKSNHGFESQPKDVNAMAHAQASKAVQEVQAALMIAAHRPRNASAAFERIMQACDRPLLAEQAIYVYPKGKTVVTGPSIRLAEELARNWGNMHTGLREISQENGTSIVEAFAWDLEANYQDTKIFQVTHIRHTKTGSYKLTDSRDVYELVANNGARRKRACILAVIPGDIIDAAVERCKNTLSSGKDPLAERLKKLIVAFSEVGVKVEHIEKRLGHNLDAIIESELVILRGMYKSLKDGVAKREDFFEIGSIVPGDMAGIGAKLDKLASDIGRKRIDPKEYEYASDDVKNFFEGAEPKSQAEVF